MSVGGGFASGFPRGAEGRRQARWDRRPVSPPRSARATGWAAVEVDAELHVTCDEAGDRANVAIAGWLRGDVRHAALRAPLDQSGATTLPLGVADPFIWLQLIDDLGAPVTEEVFLGHGIGRCYRLHAQVGLGWSVTDVACTAADAADDNVPWTEPGRIPDATLRGLYARLLLRTYCNDRGPRFTTEVLILTLLPAGYPLHAWWPVAQGRDESAAGSGIGPSVCLTSGAGASRL